MFKLLVTPFVVTLEFFLDGKQLSYMRAITLGLVCFGVLLCSGGDLAFSVRGTAAASLWVPLAAV